MKLAYTAFNTKVFEQVPASAIDILDIGCGTGSMGTALLQAVPGRQLTGITYAADEAEQARKNYRQVYVHDLNKLDLQLEGSFDCIILSHVLEHTMWPGNVLKHYLQWLKPGGIVIIALPNILFFKNRWQLMRGRFRYNPNGGLMDATHFRFFDFFTARQLARDAGLQIRLARGYGAFPLPLIRRILPALATRLDDVFCRWFPGLFSFQYVIVGMKS